ncbi:anti-sigma factor family protein [Kallotenue papyrolyticum]|uniref:anti-sigma factor family protein n=1 Tax=Kallotenue papyrolyticum TaxID=1325125 RepID=UPI0004785607|nr:hypothetical protein [Kallotenue papyrolyticum]
MERLTHNHPEDTSELLSAYSDSRLDLVERRRAESYLQRCPACAQELQELRLLKQVLRELPTLQPRRSFTLDPARVAPPRRLLFPTLRWATLVATALLVVLLGVDALRPSVHQAAQPLSATSGAAPRDAQSENAPAIQMQPESAPLPTPAGPAAAVAPEVLSSPPAAPDAGTGSAPDAPSILAATPAAGAAEPEAQTRSFQSTEADQNSGQPADQVSSAAQRGLPWNGLRVAQIIIAALALALLIVTLLAWRRGW